MTGFFEANFAAHGSSVPAAVFVALWLHGGLNRYQNRT